MHFGYALEFYHAEAQYILEAVLYYNIARHCIHTHRGTSSTLAWDWTGDSSYLNEEADERGEKSIILGDFRCPGERFVSSTSAIIFRIVRMYS